MNYTQFNINKCINYIFVNLIWTQHLLITNLTMINYYQDLWASKQYKLLRQVQIWSWKYIVSLEKLWIHKIIARKLHYSRIRGNGCQRRCLNQIQNWNIFRQETLNILSRGVRAMTSHAMLIVFHNYSVLPNILAICSLVKFS